MLRGRERPPFKLELDVLVLQPAKPLVRVGDGIEGLYHLGLELSLDCRNGESNLRVVVVIEGALSDISVAHCFLAGGRLERSGGRNGRSRRR